MSSQPHLQRGSASDQSFRPRTMPGWKHEKLPMLGPFVQPECISSEQRWMLAGQKRFEQPQSEQTCWVVAAQVRSISRLFFHLWIWQQGIKSKLAAGVECTFRNEASTGSPPVASPSSPHVLVELSRCGPRAEKNRHFVACHI